MMQIILYARFFVGSVIALFSIVVSSWLALLVILVKEYFSHFDTVLERVCTYNTLDINPSSTGPIPPAAVATVAAASVRCESCQVHLHWPLSTVLRHTLHIRMYIPPTAVVMLSSALSLSWSP